MNTQEAWQQAWKEASTDPYRYYFLQRDVDMAREWHRKGWEQGIASLETKIDSQEVKIAELTDSLMDVISHLKQLQGYS